MLPLALRVGEAQVHPFDLIVLDRLEDLARVGRHFPNSLLVPRRKPGPSSSLPEIKRTGPLPSQGHVFANPDARAQIPAVCPGVMRGVNFSRISSPPGAR